MMTVMIVTVVTFDRKIKRQNLNVAITRPRVSTCPISNGSLFLLSYVIGSVQVNGLVQLLIVSLLTVPSPRGGTLADEAIST